MKQAGQSSFVPASAEKQLEVNDQVQTGEDGRARLDLSSGTIIRVAPSSLFTLTSNEPVEGGLATQIKMELGKIFIILNGGSAEVETPAGVAAVQGSYLKIEFDPANNTLTLTCLEGNCSATTLDGDTKNFSDGQKIVIQKDPATGKWVIIEGDMSAEDFQEWLENNPEAQSLVEQATGNESNGNGGGGGGAGVCAGATKPDAGASLPFQGAVKFEWDAQPGAASYLIQFTNPSGAVITFQTSNTSLEKYIEGFLPDEGESGWSVSALDANGGTICTTTPSTFTKPDSNWEPEPKGDGTEDEKKSCSYYCY
jgi:hypothetical protein